MSAIDWADVGWGTDLAWARAHGDTEALTQHEAGWDAARRADALRDAAEAPARAAEKALSAGDLAKWAEKVLLADALTTAAATRIEQVRQPLDALKAAVERRRRTVARWLAHAPECPEGADPGLWESEQSHRALMAGLGQPVL